MRPLRDLVGELAALAPKCTLAWILVSFGDDMELVKHQPMDGGDPLAELRALVSDGGHPLAIIASAWVQGRFQISILPFKGTRWTAGDRKHLTAFVKNLMDRLKEEGLEPHRFNPALN